MVYAVCVGPGGKIKRFSVLVCGRAKMLIWLEARVILVRRLFLHAQYRPKHQSRKQNCIESTPIWIAVIWWLVWYNSWHGLQGGGMHLWPQLKTLIKPTDNFLQNSVYTFDRTYIKCSDWKAYLFNCLLRMECKCLQMRRKLLFIKYLIWTFTIIPMRILMKWHSRGQGCPDVDTGSWHIHFITVWM